MTGDLRVLLALGIALLLLLPSHGPVGVGLAGTNRCSNCVVQTFPIPPATPGSSSPTYDPSNGQVLVPDCSDLSDCGVVLINGTTGTEIGNISTPVPDMGFAYDPVNGDLYTPVFTTQQAYIEVLSGGPEVQVGTVPLPLGGTYGFVDITFDPAHNDIDLAEGSYLVEVNATTNQRVAEDRVGTNDWFLASTQNGQVLLDDPVDFPNDNDLIEVDGETAAVEVNRSFPFDTQAMTYDPGNDQVYVTGVNVNVPSLYPGVVQPFNVSDDQAVAPIYVPSGAEGIAYDPGNGDVYVADSGSSEITVIRGSNDAVVANISTDPLPNNLAYDSENGCLYVLTSDDGGPYLDEVSVVSPPGGTCPVAPQPVSYALLADVALAALVAAFFVVLFVWARQRKKRSLPPPVASASDRREPPGAEPGPTASGPPNGRVRDVAP